MIGGFKSIYTALFRLLFPYLCVHCKRELDGVDSLCSCCRLDLISFKEIAQAEELMKAIFAGRVPLERASSLYYFSQSTAIQSLLHALKYHHRTDIGSAFGEIMAKEIVQWNSPPDVILPVPIHPAKRKIRGYNQSELITQALAKRAGIEERTDLLLRRTHTQSNTKLSRLERWNNVGNSFSWNGEENSEKHYLLVDDVLTTGATIEACIQSALESCPNSKWSVFTAAMVWRD